jgi:hypothetical protein
MFIPDPGSDFFPSRIRTVSIPDPGSSSKILSILTPKKAKKWFLSSKKYDPGCSYQILGLFIPDPDADFLPSRIPDPGGQKDTQSRIRNTADTVDNIRLNVAAVIAGGVGASVRIRILIEFAGWIRIRIHVGVWEFRPE